MSYKRVITRSHKFHMIFRSGGDKELIGEMLLEHSLDIFVNGQPLFRCACTPMDLEELVAGRLFAEGIITRFEEIADLRICDESRRAEVVTRTAETADLGSGRADGDAGSMAERAGNVALRNGATDGDAGNMAGRAGNATVAEALTASAQPGGSHISEHFQWKPEWIFQLADSFAEDTGLHRDTACAHSCFLARENHILYSAEDISRHNALDKAVGWALIHQIPLEESILFTSGRLPADILDKVIRAGVPLVASNAAPTEDAIELAEKAGVIVIGTVRPEKMRVYT